MLASKYFHSTIISIIFLVFTPSCARAESTLTDVQPIVLSAVVPLHGRVVVSLDKKKDFGIKTAAKFYQGTIKYRGVSYPASGSIINGITKITFNGRKIGSRKSRQRLYSLTVRNGANTIRVSGVPSSAMPEKSCPLHTHDAAVIPASAKASATSTKVIYISTYADPEFAYLVGANTNDEIARIINTAEALYEQQLGIRFKIREQVVLTNSTPELIPGSVLDTFRAKLTSYNSDTQVLFTGKDMTGNTVGIAYVGAICREPTFAQSVVQLYGDLTSNIFAHELGHTFGAPHDTNARGSIMYPSISFGQPYFSSQSVSDINSYLSVYGTCLKTETLPPSLSTAKLSIRRGKMSNVSFVLTSQSGEPISNETIKLQFGRKTVFVVTNTKGIATIRLARYKGKYLYMYAELVNNDSIHAYGIIRIT